MIMLFDYLAPRGAAIVISFSPVVNDNVVRLSCTARSRNCHLFLSCCSSLLHRAEPQLPSLSLVLFVPVAPRGAAIVISFVVLVVPVAPRGAAIAISFSRVVDDHV